MRAEEELAKYREGIEALCRKYHVKRLRLFGSAVRDDWDPDKSDFDFLAEFHEPPGTMSLGVQFFGLAYELEELLGRRVDLVDWKTTRKPVFREAAEREAVEWYAA